MEKFIKSMLLLFVAVTITHTPTFGQLSYSLPPEKIERSYTLPNYPSTHNQDLSQNVEPKIEKKSEAVAKEETTNPYTSKPSNLAFPKVPYPTMAIGQFMSFCSSAMMRRFQQGAAQGARIDPQTAAMSTQFVCSCIMDNYRKNNEYAEYQYEFTRGKSRDVPLFSNYMKECSVMNQQNMTKYMAAPAPTQTVPQYPARNPQRMH